MKKKKRGATAPLPVKGQLTETEAILAWIALGAVIIAYGICAVVGFFTIVGWLK